MSVEFKELSGWPKPGLVQCPIRFALDLLAGKWRLPIICSLMEERAMRWGELKRRLKGITNTMLAGALTELQAAGLVKRTQYNEMPLRVEYSLTEVGHDLGPILRRLGQWGLEALQSEAEVPEVAEAQEFVMEEAG